MNRVTMLALGAGSLLVAVAVVAAPRSAVGGAREGHAAESGVAPAVPAESPGIDEDCYEWTYPKKDTCGALSGTSECKAEPTIDSAADEKKKEECKPTKGDLCLCDQ